MTRETSARASKDDERVLVVPSRLFYELGSFQGLLAERLERYDALFDPRAAIFMRRGDAERDWDYKQLIPYVIFCACSNRSVSVFSYRRGEDSGESRLRARWSIGIGGHVNEQDGSSSSSESLDPFEVGARREIAEETRIDAKILSFRKVALVNDDATDVGKVHLGVVCLAVLDEPKMSSNETDLVDASFRSIDELLNDCKNEPEKFQSGSLLALQGLFDSPCATQILSPWLQV